MIKRISNEFSFHTMYYETRCVLYIPSPEARGYKTHYSFHNTSYGMKIHLRSYIYSCNFVWFQIHYLNKKKKHIFENKFHKFFQICLWSKYHILGFFSKCYENILSTNSYHNIYIYSVFCYCMYEHKIFLPSYFDKTVTMT